MLTAGVRLGPYEIVSPLGAGAMGEVYKARDKRLDRTVAIKILPPDVASDPQRKERLRREARAISSLTHPHICTLYDVGEQDGIDFLVMEYLAGETLAHRLLRGALPLDDVLRIAAQLADALDSAHRQGLVHRDLKPANVMLTASGAKVLDFGLARWFRDESSDAHADSAATAHPTLTQAGTIVGTVQYMAPEQIEGKPADARSDLFALGAILYEMTTGRRAFEGETSASVTAAILRSTPPPIGMLEPLAPPALEHVVKNCLAKDPERRWQSAGDIARELTWISETGSQAAAQAISQALPKRRTYYWIGATFILAVLTALLGFARFRQPRAAAREIRLFTPPPEHTAYPDLNLIQSAPVVSPDGRHVAIVAHEVGGADQVWVRSLDDLAARALPGTESAFGWRPFWSPDSRSLAFFANGKLKRVDLAGGAPQVLADAPDPHGATWGAQNVIVFAPSSEGALHRVSASGGPTTPATTLRPPETGHRFPVFLPDGQHFLYRSWDPPLFRNTGIEVGALDSSEVTRLFAPQQPLFDVAYANTGHLLFVRKGTLVAQKFDVARLAIEGEPMTIANRVNADTATGGMFSISTNGVLVYRQEAAEVTSQLVWLDRTGRRVGLVGAPGNQDEPRLSPDGTRVAVRRGLEPGHDDIWILNVTTGKESRLTFDSGNYLPFWSPDGRAVAFGARRLEPDGLLNGVFRRMSSGVGDVETLVKARLATNPSDWSHDGKFIIYDDRHPLTKSDIWALPLGGGRKPFALVRTAEDDEFGQLSPDGRWLAYISKATGRWKVYIQGFPVARGKWQVSTSGGTQPRWRRDGKELFYVAADVQLMAVPIKPGIESFETGTHVPLFAMPPSSREDISYDVSADGRFLANTLVSDTSQPVVVVLNWTEVLKK